MCYNPGTWHNSSQVKLTSEESCQRTKYKKKKKKNYGPFLWMGFNWLKTRATSRRQFTFYHYVPRNSCYSFYRPRKDESILEPASGFEHGTPRWGIQRLNQQAIAQNLIGNNCANLTWKQLCHVPGLQHMIAHFCLCNRRERVLLTLSHNSSRPVHFRKLY